MVDHLKIYFYNETLTSLLSYAKDMHPKEIFLLLRGKKYKDGILVEEFLLPPSTILGEGFAAFKPSMIPIDFSIIGTVHSHPSGILIPSAEDYNNMYGLIMVVIAYPYHNIKNIAIFNRSGEYIPFKILDNIDY